MGDEPRNAVVIGAVRTAIADAYRGALTNVAIHGLATTVVSEALARSGAPADQVDDLVKHKEAELLEV